MKAAQDDVIEVYTRAKARAATLWLHGLGVNAGDMDGVIANMRRSRELGLHYVAPNAPLRPITVNNGMPARAWFDVAGDPAEVPPGQESLADSCRRVHVLLDRERQRGFPSQTVLLGGFSQGASMSLYAGLRYPHRLAGIVVMSGELPLPDLLARERHPANADTPIMMIHGTEDEAIPLADARRSRDHLLGLGQPVEWHELPVGHTVSLDTIALVDEWAYRHLAAALA